MAKWWLIRNPVAGKGRAERDWSSIAAALNEAGISYQAHPSNSFEHAIELAATGYAAGFRHFIVIGGDGSLNEVINGIADDDADRLKDVTIALIPVGKGNDWCRSLQLPSAYAKAAKMIAIAHTIPHDIAFVSYKTPSGITKQRLFINIAGLGFDASVAKTVNDAIRDGKRLTKLSYLWHMLLVLLHFKPIQASYSGPNANAENEQIFSMAIGKGQYNGGGMRQIPHAKPNDGQLGITIIKAIPAWEVLVNIGRLFTGSFVKHRKVDTWSANEFTVTSPGLLVETDGESLGTTPATFGLLTNYLQVVAPKEI